MLSPFMMEQRNNPVAMQLEGFRMAAGRADGAPAPRARARPGPAHRHRRLLLGEHEGRLPGAASAARSATTRTCRRALRHHRRAWTKAVRYPAGTDTWQSGAMGVGLVTTLALMWLKLRFQWWPLHPVAYPIATGSTIQALTLGDLRHLADQGGAAALRRPAHAPHRAAPLPGTARRRARWRRCCGGACRCCWG